MIEKVRLNEDYVHIKTGNIYTVTELNVKIKMLDEWINGVEYKRKEDDNVVYVRPILEFMKKFKKATNFKLVRAYCYENVIVEAGDYIAYKKDKEYVFFTKDDIYIGFDEIDDYPHLFYEEEFVQYFDIDGMASFELDKYIKGEAE